MSAIIEAFTTMKAVFPDAVVQVAIKISDNVTTTMDGLSPEQTTSRAISGGGLAENVDTEIFVLKESISDVSVLRGKSAIMTIGSKETAIRIMATRDMGGVVVLMCGDYDKVAQ